MRKGTAAADRLRSGATPLSLHTAAKPQCASMFQRLLTDFQRTLSPLATPNCRWPGQELVAGPISGGMTFSKGLIAHSIPSHMAQAEMPLFQYSSSLGRPSLFAVAPVAKITELVFTWNSEAALRGCRGFMHNGKLCARLTW